MSSTALDIEDDDVNGPFSTVDATVGVSFDELTAMSKRGTIFWTDHTKLSYYSFAEIMPRHANAAVWSYANICQYDTTGSNEVTTVNYGRIRIFKYGTRYVIKDTFTLEMYLAFDIRSAMEISVMVVHFYPNERVLPDIRDGRLPKLEKTYPTQADFGIVSSADINGIYVDSGKAPLSTKVNIEVSLADAISIIQSDKPSPEFLSNLCASFPTALIAAYGSPLIVYNTQTTLIGVAQSLASTGLAHKILSADAIDNFVKDKMVGPMRIVGGWGYPYLEQAGNERDRVALVDLALSQSSSPAMLEIHLANLSF
jgi:hypothetical protein